MAYRPDSRTSSWFDTEAKEYKLQAEFSMVLCQDLERLTSHLSDAGGVPNSRVDLS